MSRQIRVILYEKKIEFKSVTENYWLKETAFPELSPVAGIPILSIGALAFSDSAAIYEYLEETFLDNPLMSEDSVSRADCRRISNCFNGSFFNLLSKPVIMERVVSFLKKTNPPNSNLIRQIRYDVVYFLDYVGYLLKNSKWLAGNSMSLADIVVACHFSVLDYFGDIPWKKNELVKDWYSVMKSRPSFRSILTDRIPGYKPVEHYDVLDF